MVCPRFYVTLCPRETLRLILMREGTEHAETAAPRVVDSSQILHWSVPSVNYSLQTGTSGARRSSSGGGLVDRRERRPGGVLLLVNIIVGAERASAGDARRRKTKPGFRLILFITAFTAADAQSSQMNTSKHETRRGPERKSDFYL